MQTAQFQLHADIEERHWWFVARRQILSEVIQTVLPEESTIVDVGCGTGANLAALSNRYRCVGIDTSGQAIALAKARFPEVTFIHGMAPRDLGNVMRRARLILLTDVMEHVADDFLLFSELLATAQPGTYFLMTVPADLALWSEHDQTYGHYRRYDVERFRQVWQGLAVYEIFTSHFNSRLFPVVKAIRQWNRWLDQSSGAVGTDFQIPNAGINYLLTRCFAGERSRLARLARGERALPYPFGVSLMALVQRTGGHVEAREKPSIVTPDYFNPAAAELVGAGA